MPYPFYSAILPLFSASRACDNVRAIYSRERWISYDRFADSAAWCAQTMRDHGLAEVESNELRADGTVYGDRRVPNAWCARSATLRFPDGETLCDYQSIPCSLSMYSSPTPAGGVTAQVVVIDDPASPPPDEELRGKLLLTDRPSGAVGTIAARAGAVGILHDFFPLFPGVRDSREEMRGVHRWDCLHPRNAGLFAFSLAPEQGDRLRHLAKAGPVTLHAEVDAGDCDGSLYVISGAIPGTEPDLPEVILYGHLDEPGANDNASGCGALLELGRAMTEAIAEGLLPRPRHTIRIVMGPEYEGSMGYIHYHPDRPRLAFIAADMIGSESADRACMKVTHGPLANFSYADAAIFLANRRYCEHAGVTHRCNAHPYWAGSDNFVADPSLATPAVAFGNFPAQSYHSSLDSMERIEPEILKRNACIVGDFAYMLAAADLAVCDALAQELRAQCGALIRDAATERLRALCQEAYARALHSLKRLVPAYEPPVPFAEHAEPAPDPVSARIPVRLVKGPLGFAAHPAIRAAGALCPGYETALFWTDGQRSLWDITVRTAAERGVEACELLGQHLRLFNALAEFGYVGWRE